MLLLLLLLPNPNGRSIMMHKESSGRGNDLSYTTLRMSFDKSKGSNS